ncbi:hypothetical protein [Streptomyces sp. NPDC005507]|uniref:hypothetical protein n=1 Tax=Streptomyces sp. NPDC005507 TaxID=3154885 RepID=UPI0033A5FA82
MPLIHALAGLGASNHGAGFVYPAVRGTAGCREDDAAVFVNGRPVVDGAVSEHDLRADLRGCADPAERVHLVAHMLQRASELVLLVGGHWLGGGKWLSRRLAAADPGLHRALTEAAAQAITEDTNVFAAAVTEVLDRAGGPLWDGYTVR